MNAIKSFVFFVIAVLCIFGAVVLSFFTDDWDAIMVITVIGAVSVLTSAYYSDYGKDE